MQQADDEKENSSDEKILEIARKRFAFASEAEADIRREALDDLKFSAGEQWPDHVKSERDRDKRPCLVINRLPQFIRQITNDQRRNRPAIKVSPVDDKADIETAKVYQGLIRHIEYASNADTAYDTAFDSAARAGFGYFRIVTEYCDPFSFDQDIRVKRVPDRFSVYLDPSYQEPDGSDANWGFVFEDISKDEFKAQYPKAELTAMSEWTSVGDSFGDWVKEDRVRIAEYFTKEWRETTIYRLADGSVVEKDDLVEGAIVIDERKTLVPSIKWFKTNGIEILEKTDWPGKWIPIIPVLGEELIIEGKRTLAGVVRYAKDPQRMYNYWKSSETETIALAPRAPWIGAEGQFEGHEAQWATANSRNHAFLQYKPKALGGQPLAPPQRNVFEPPVQAITQASMFAADDLKATTGIYDAAMGNQSNEKSGIAIQRRAAQSQTSNFHLVDNLSKSIRHAGRIICDLIPSIYDTERTARIIGEDGSEEVVKLNQEFEHKGKPVTYQLNVGKYDVTVDTGPSFETKRQEAVASMSEMARAYPPLMQFAGDIMVKNMDWPGAQEIAERIKKTLAPELRDDDKAQQPLPPEAQAQMAQMSQMIEMLTQQLNAAQDKIETKAMEIESRERIEMQKLQVQVELEMAKMGSTEAQMLLKQEIAQLERRMDMLGQNQELNFDEEQEMAAGPDQQAGFAPMEQAPMPTGGLTPGEYME